MNHSEFPWEELARGPVGMPVEVGEADGIVGDALGADGPVGAPPQVGPVSLLAPEKDPTRPPLECEEPREGGLYPRGPEGGTRVPDDSDRAVFGGGDLIDAEKFLLALGPVGGALNPAGPRGGDRGRCGERGGSLCGADGAGDLSYGVDFDDSLSLDGNGDLPLERSSRVVDCCNASLLGWT